MSKRGTILHIYNCSYALTTRMFHVVSASAALQTTSEYFLQAFRSCATDLMCSKSSFLLKVGIGKPLFIDFALLMSLFNLTYRLQKDARRKQGHSF